MKCISKVLGLLVVLLVTGCNQTNRQEAERNAAPESEITEREHVQEKDLSTADVYEGIMPGDDTDEEVKLTLTLYPDQTYTEHIVYDDRQGETTFMEGTYRSEGDILILEHTNGAKEYYRQGVDQLHLLDDNRQNITDPDQMFILDKNPKEVAQPYPTPL